MIIINSKTKDELIKSYLESLKEDTIPWRKGWTSSLNVNGISNKQYKGINQLLLLYINYKEKYNDNRWFTYVQIKEKGYKLKNSKGKGVPVEFWSVYDLVNKKKIDIVDYNSIIQNHPELKERYKIFCNTSFVFNASLIEGVPKIERSNKMIEPNNLIKKIIHNLKVKYKECGNQAFYSPVDDEIVLPKSECFKDKYSYYATQLHEICHSTGHEKRLKRTLIGNDKKDYAREELIAEISSSFLMQQLDIDPKSDDYNNHKSYIQSWITILEDKPNELFKAINESNKVCDYINENMKNKEREAIR